MGVQEILHDTIGSVRGAQFAGIVGTDGLSIAMAYSPATLDMELELAELELAELASAASAAADRIGSGRVRDMVVETDDLTYLVSLITPGYYAVLGVLSEAANVGKARFAVQTLVERVRVEL